MDFLSESDIQSLDEVIARVSKMSFDDIYTDTHGTEWERAFNSKKKGKTVMDIVKIAEEGGADESTIAYLKEYIELEKALG